MNIYTGQDALNMARKAFSGNSQIIFSQGDGEKLVESIQKSIVQKESPLNFLQKTQTAKPTSPRRRPKLS